MWVAIVIIIIALLLVLAMPKPNVENARAAKLGDFNIPRAKWGDPMPLVWGTVRQKSPICIWFGDYNPVPIKQKQPSGLFSSKKVIVGYKNYVGIDLVLALGPKIILKKFWSGSKLVWSGNLTTNGDVYINAPELFGGEKQQGGLQGTFSFYDGRFDPPQDPYLQAKIEPDVPAYNGWARVVFKSFYIGTTTNLDAFSFEISNLSKSLSLAYSVMPNELDVNPLEICYDAITGDYGRFNATADDIDLPSFVRDAETLYDEGLGMSLLVQSAITGKDMLEEVARLADLLLYQEPTNQKVVSRLIRNDYDVDTLPVLDKSIVKDIRNFSKTTWENTFNQCRVSFKDRENDYEDSVAVEQDFANINYQQRVKSTEINSPGCYVSNTASLLAARQLSFVSIPIYKCELLCKRKTASKLRPGDCFVLNWEPYGLTRMVMRVSKISLGTLKNGAVKVTCVQDKFATQLPTFAPPDGTGWTPIDTTAKVVTNRRIFVPPYFLAHTQTEAIADFNTEGRMYAVAMEPAQSSIFFDAASSFDNFATESDAALDDAPYNGGGTLIDDYDISNGGVDLHDTSGDLIVSGIAQKAVDSLKQYTTLTEARDGSALLLLNDELLVYVGFTDNGNGSVTFDNVYRGVLDTLPATHPAGSKVYFIDGQDGLLAPKITIGSNLYVKLLDSTPVATMPESGAPTDTVNQSNRQRRPLRPQYVTLNGSRAPTSVTDGDPVTVEWRNRTRLADALAVYNDASATLETGVQTVVSWRFGAGSWNALAPTTGTSIAIPYNDVGTLQVKVESQLISDSTLSLNQELISVNIAATGYVGTYEDIIAMLPLIARWRCDESSGTTLADISGNGYDATFNTVPGWGEPSLIYDATNTAVELDGTMYADIDPAVMTLPNGGNGTIAVVAWLKGPALNGSLITARNAGGNTVLDFVIGYNGASGSAYYPGLIVRDDAGGGLAYATSSVAVNDDVTHMIVWRIRAGKVCSVIVDGVTVATVTHGMTAGVTPTATYTRLFDEALNGAIVNLTGIADEVMVFTDLDNSAVAALYQAGTTGSAP